MRSGCPRKCQHKGGCFALCKQDNYSQEYIPDMLLHIQKAVLTKIVNKVKEMCLLQNLCNQACF